MSKITKTIREKISLDAITESYKAKSDDIKKREQKLAIECYNSVFPKKIRDIVNSLPEGWTRKCTCLKFNAGGWQVTLCAEKELSTPTTHCSVLGSLTGDLATKVQNFSQEKKSLDENYRADIRKIYGFLEGFSTFKQLKKAWPEGEKFYKKYNADRISPSVPAVVTEEINKILGLKK